MTKRFITERELSAMIGIAIPTLQTWRSRKQGIPFAKICGAVRYDIDKVTAWIEQQSSDYIHNQ